MTLLPPEVIRRTRTRALRTISSRPSIDRTVRAAAVRRARRRGVPDALSSEIADPALPLDRALQLAAWAIALRGRGRPPRHFDPGDHLVRPEARAAAAAELRRVADRDRRLERALIHVDDDLSVPDAAHQIRDHLRLALDRRRGRPHDRPLASAAVQRELTATVTERLDRAGVPAFLMSGTLLGFHRDGRFLESDYDVDLGVLPGTSVREVFDLLADALAWDVRIEDERVVVTHPDGVAADVFVHVERDGRWWHSTSIHEWWNSPFELRRAELDGVPVWVPDDPARYLDENYGRWRDRPAFYDMTFDTPNREYRENLDALRFLHHRCLRGIETGDRWSVESAARELRNRFGVDLDDMLADSPLLG